MKFQLFSDTHCFGHYMPPITDADILVCLGDIDVGLNFENWVKNILFVHKKPFIFIPGNHDFYLDKTFEEWISYYDSIDIEDFYILQNKHIEIKGYNFVGTTFWTNYQDNPSMELAAAVSGIKDFSYIKKKNGKNLSTTKIKFLNSEATFFLDNCLKKLDLNKTVVLSHFPPALPCTSKYEFKTATNGHFCSNYDNKIAYEWPVNVWCYGHTHMNYNFVFANTRMICNPIGGFHRDGRTKNPDFINDLIIEVK